MTGGVLIAHRYHHRAILYLVPILTKPIARPRACNLCHTAHPCKTIHLELSPTGTAIVSHGVLADLKSAGMPDLDVVGAVAEPPPVHIGLKAPSRMAQDYQNNAQRIWSSDGRTGTAGSRTGRSRVGANTT